MLHFLIAVLNAYYGQKHCDLNHRSCLWKNAERITALSGLQEYLIGNVASVPGKVEINAFHRMQASHPKAKKGGMHGGTGC